MKINETAGVTEKTQLLESVTQQNQFVSGSRDVAALFRIAENETYSPDKLLSVPQKNIDTKNSPFIKINTKSGFNDITVINSRKNLPTPRENENISENPKFKDPIYARGLEDESDDYAFSSYPKSSQKLQLGGIRAKLEHFYDITGNEKATFRGLYGSDKGDKEFNFDGTGIGLELEVKQKGYLVNQKPEIPLPIDNGTNYFFEQRNINVAPNNGNLSVVIALEGVKAGLKYERGKGFGLGTLEFNDGAITTNIVDFTKKYPYIAIPVYAAVASAAVTGGYFLNKGKDEFNIDLGNITVYKNETEKGNLKVGISPSITLTGNENFTKAFKVPGAAASVLYKYDNNLTLNFNGGYNPVDGPHVFAGAAMKF